ncbi:hypothetical protein O3V59_07635 [Brevibacillus thermoruber]|uniref:Uncharacterized protein n=1 Tax=Brevibacillus thermoruber TaxID=33942 RepID=A0A9X3Z307_9BACL|nr:hypothetical protein [Brevibacillus thermoruber]MDA5108228.1 hypothetical protein [Brevibacillus thermoruber]
MVILGWKRRLHVMFAGKLLGRELYADEGYVTQLLEMGQQEAIADFDRDLQAMIVRS